MAAKKEPDSVLGWLSALQNGEAEAANRLWDRYYPKLIALAGRKLPKRLKRTCDEEDIAASAFASFCRAAGAGRLPSIDDRDSLWKLLAVIAARKVTAQIRRNSAKKRGAAMVRGESIFEFGDSGEANAGGIGQVVGRAPTPEFAAAVSEELEILLAALPDEALRSVAVDKLAGYSNAEIAERLNCVERTVSRKLLIIREIWKKVSPETIEA